MTTVILLRLERLQRIQNMACRIIFNIRKFDHISIHMQELHWLKVPERIEFKFALLVFHCIHGEAPSYLQSLLTRKSGYCLRSSASYQLRTSHCSNSLARNGAFQHLGLKVWNSLPVELRLITNLSLFKRKLKAHMFCRSYPNLS